MRNCDQVFITRQQVNFKLDTISSLLFLICSNVKSHREALFAFQMNIMIIIPFLLSQIVPMSLLPKEFLEKTLELLDDEQEKSKNCLSLDISKQK